MSDTHQRERCHTGPTAHSDLLIAGAFVLACAYVLVLQIWQAARPDIALLASTSEVVQLSSYPLEINSQIDPSSLRGFFPPEDHGAWLGDGPGRIALRAEGSLFPAGIKLLVKAASSGQSESRTLTIRANNETNDFVLESGSTALVEVAFERTQDVVLQIECRPSARPPDDLRALCVLISQIEFIE